MKKINNRVYLEVGDVLNNLTIISVAEKKNKDHHKYYLCRCSCGNEKIFKGIFISNGIIKSCGCVSSSIPRVFSKNKEAAIQYAFDVYKNSAKVMNRCFDISLEHFVELTQQNCRYCGVVPSNIARVINGDNFEYNGLDRIDNTKGYTLDNVVPCCLHCNQAKSNLTKKEFLEHVIKIYHHFAKSKQ